MFVGDVTVRLHNQITGAFAAIQWSTAVISQSAPGGGGEGGGGGGGGGGGWGVGGWGGSPRAIPPPPPRQLQARPATGFEPRGSGGGETALHSDRIGSFASWAKERWRRAGRWA